MFRYDGELVPPHRFDVDKALHGVTLLTNDTLELTLSVNIDKDGSRIKTTIPIFKPFGVRKFIGKLFAHDPYIFQMSGIDLDQGRVTLQVLSTSGSLDTSERIHGLQEWLGKYWTYPKLKNERQALALPDAPILNQVTSINKLAPSSSALGDFIGVRDVG